MWVLECDGDLLQGKRLWLRPESQHLFGRTRSSGNGERNHVIENKSVSRKHVLVSVSSATGKGSNPDAKSEVVIHDDSKIGTYLNGEKFSKTSRTLPKQRDEHTLQLGNYDQKLKIRWKPAILTLALTSKDLKDKLTAGREHLEACDIKVVPEYITGKTTHVVADKRNTSKGLQALVSAKHIVTDAFIDALMVAATSATNANDPDTLSPSPLELDFDGNWPKELAFLPPEGKEPIPRPAEFFAPDPKRTDVFTHFTFIFGDSSQFESLQGPINTGGGKALLFELSHGQTSVDEFATYVRSVAGENGLAESSAVEPEHVGLKKHVVVVHARAKKGFEDWVANFTREVELRLGQRSMEQNQFLDAILTNDACGLHKQLEDDPDPPPDRTQSSTRPPVAPRDVAASKDYPDNEGTHDSVGNESSRQAASEVHVPSSEPKPEPEQSPSRRRGRRGITASRFRGFDDFDPSQIPQRPNGNDDESYMEGVGSVDESVPAGMTADSQGLFVGDSHPQVGGATSRKRRDPPSEDSVNEEEVIDGLFPAAAALKRRRLDEGRSAKTPARNSRVDPKGKEIKAALAKRKAKGETNIDVLGLTRQRREAEDEAARQDAESLEQALETMDIEAMRNLAQVEEMEVPTRTNRLSHKDVDSRWEERWNGRKNFKKFRRKGSEHAPMRGQRVIVPLEEVKRKEFGIGDDYWLESRREPEQRGTREHAVLGQEVVEISDREGEGELSPQSFTKTAPIRKRNQATRESEGVAVGGSLQSSRASRSTGKTTQTPHSIPETVISESQGRGGGKRAAANAPAHAPPGKRAKATRSFARDESDGSEDELKFKFSRKR